MSAPTPASRPLPDVGAPRREERRFWLLVALGTLVLAAALGAAWYMEERGHVVTGMTNRVVWGLPHVFAILLIVVASGALNVGSIGSVFGHAPYKLRAPLSGLLCLAPLAGGLLVLVLDLGRPERLIVAATTYNFRSIFAWNIFLYSGMFAVVAVYLWTLMEQRMNRWAKPVGMVAFIWRLVLTTGTGSIFGFLVARQAYASGLLAPMFIAMSFAWGLAVFLVVQYAIFVWNAMEVPPEVHRRMRNLLGVFVAAVLYFVAVFHLTNGYWARQHAFERFILLDGGVYPVLFWAGYVVLGSLVPLVLLWHPRLGGTVATLAASLLVIVGAFAQLYVFIIGGQVFPLDMFPGYEVSSTALDGQIARYVPTLPEILLGLGGLAAAFLITAIGVRVLDFLPRDDTRGGKGGTGRPTAGPTPAGAPPKAPAAAGG